MSSPVIANCVLADHLAQRRARQRRLRAAGAISGSDGKSSRGSVCMRESKRSAATLHAGLVLLDPDVGLRKRLDDLVELLRRQRQRPALRHRRLTPAAQRDFEIGREHPDLITLRFDQHVRQDRNRVLALDDALEELQFAQKLILPNDEFHKACGDLERSVDDRR